MEKPVIWCVDDDDTIRDIEVYTLTQTGFAARGFADGVSMLTALKAEADMPDLIVLDIMLPTKDGTEVLRDIRHNSKWRQIPIIMATAKGSEMDKIQSLDGGADDYLVKPFGVMEMVSRVKAVLRRCAAVDRAERLEFGEIVLDDRAHIVTVDGERVNLTFKEFAILRLFMEQPGAVLSRERLLTEVWGQDFLGESRTVDMHIKTLRQKLGSAAGYIATVIGVGYRLETKQ